MKEIYLCDIDGTLADHEGIRSPYDESKVHLDRTLPTCRIINTLIKSGERVLFFSGRTENCRQATIKWLKDNLFLHSEEIELYMRASDDKRNDAIIKEELYRKYIEGKYKVIGVFDDRLRVVRMWESLGIFVFNCNQGLKEF